MKSTLLRTAAALALLALPLAGCAATKSAESAVQADATLRADAAARAALREGPFAGIAVAVSRDGKLIYQGGFGLADTERQIAVKPDTRFPVGSITKPMTCLAVQQLAEAGRIDTDAPAGRYLPSLPAPARDVPVRNLLDHTSGIENYLEIKTFPYRQPTGFSREDMVKFFADKPLRFPSGTRFSYSNSNTYLLGLIIEAVSGERYDTYVQRHVFAPFGMAHSDFEANPDGEANRALGYQSRDGGFTPAIRYDWLVPFSAGATVSTAPDLVRFADGLFGKPADTVRTRLLARNDMGGVLNSYMQGCLVEGRLGDARKVSHSGSIYGFSSHFAHYPDQKLSVAVLTNSQGQNYPALTLSNRIARIFLGQNEPDRTDRPLDMDAAQWIAGDYAVGNRRLGFDRLGFALREGKLWLIFGGKDSGGPQLPLVNLGGDRFVSPIDSEMRLQFERTTDGAALLLRYYDGDMPFSRVSG